MYRLFFLEGILIKKMITILIILLLRIAKILLKYLNLIINLNNLKIIYFNNLF